ncbi:MAG: TetR/AcrR family transcriptional regulator [Polyangiaceae bacterium]
MSPESTDDTRSRILEAAIELCVADGLDDPSVKDVCEKAGISRATFYNYFADREELVATMLETIMGAFAVDMMDVNPPGDLLALLGKFNDELRKERSTLRGSEKWRFHHTLAACAKSALVREKYLEASQKVRQRFKMHVVLGQRDGRIRADLDPEGIVDILLGLSLGGFVFAELGQEGNTEAVAKTILGAFGVGFGP